MIVKLFDRAVKMEDFEVLAGKSKTGAFTIVIKSMDDCYIELDASESYKLIDTIQVLLRLAESQQCKA